MATDETGHTRHDLLDILRHRTHNLRIILRVALVAIGVLVKARLRVLAELGDVGLVLPVGGTKKSTKPAAAEKPNAAKGNLSEVDGLLRGAGGGADCSGLAVNVVCRGSSPFSRLKRLFRFCQ